MPSLKKIFIISSVLLLVSLFFFGIYNLAFKSKSVSDAVSQSQDYLNSQSNAAGSQSQTAAKNTPAIYAVTNESVIAPTLSGDNQNIEYYSKANGNTIQISLDGKDRKIISSANLTGLADVFWNPNKDKAISYFNSNGNSSFFLHDFKLDQSKKLPDGTDSVAWSNLGDKIIYKFFDPKTKERSISLSDPDGSNWQKLAPVNFQNVDLIQIPQNSIIAFWNSPSSSDETSLNTVGILGGDAKSIFSGKFGADYLWSPDGEKALVSSVDSKGGSKMALGMINKDGSGYMDLDIPTFVSKCVWSNDGKTIYYTLPTFSSSSMVLPDDYLSGKISSQDTFWKMDLGSGKKDRIVDLNKINGSYDAQDLFLSSDESALFFVNKSDGKLYRIDL